MGLNLITDRTQTDYEEWLALSKISWAGMTAEQKAKWSVPMKGAYNASDLNRVGNAILALQSLFAEYGYAVTVSVRVDWTAGEWPTPAEMENYLQSVANIRSVLTVLETTPATPSGMEDATIFIWNNIEQILWDVEMLINNMIASFRYCGEAVCGEV